MTTRNRYPGARPFGDSPFDQATFFGREDESRALLLQLLATNLLVLYGRSGLGKTSLANAALFPALRERDFLPLPVRFNHSDAALTPMDVIRDAIIRACAAEDIDYTPGAGDTLWEFFKTAIFWRGDRLQTPVLILSQFEELFTLQQENFRREAAAQLGQLGGRSMPRQLRDRVQRGETLPFSDKPPQLKILVSIREDFLGNLQDLAQDIPAILQTRFRLIGLSAEGGRAAITKPAMLTLDGVAFATRAFTYLPATVDEMIATAREDGGAIEPFFLQLLCSHVESQVRKKQASGDSRTVLEVDGSYLGGKEGIKALTRSFYLDALSRIPDARLRHRARRMCEDGLLTADGRRRSALNDDLEQQFGINPAALDALEHGHLLRKESRHGSSYYEIAHDRLAAAVQENRKWRMPRELKIAFAALAILLGVGAVALSLYARDQARKREHAVELARSADELAKVYNHVLDGDLNASRRQWDAAQKSFGMALESWKQRAADEPENVRWQRELAVTSERLGNVQSKLGNPIRALQDYESARRIWADLAQRDPAGSDFWQRNLAASHDKIALIRQANGNPTEALAEYRKALSIRKALVQRRPDSHDDQHELALSHDIIGDILRAQSTDESLDQALASYGEALKIRASLSAASSADQTTRRDLAASFDRHGVLLEELDRQDDALVDFQKSEELLKKLTDEQPENAVWQRELSVAYNRIAGIKEATNEPDALALFDKALEIRRKLVELDPFNLAWKLDLATSHADRAHVLEQTPETHKDALTAHQKSLDLSEEVAGRDPENVDAKVGVAQSLLSISPLLLEVRGIEAKKEAIENCQRVIAMLRPLETQNRLTGEQKSLIRYAEKLLEGLGAAPAPPPGQ